MLQAVFVCIPMLFSYDSYISVVHIIPNSSLILFVFLENFPYVEFHSPEIILLQFLHQQVIHG